MSNLDYTLILGTQSTQYPIEDRKKGKIGIPLTYQGLWRNYLACLRRSPRLDLSALLHR